MAVSRTIKADFNIAPTYISFDPGANTGIICWDGTGVPINVQVLREADLDDFLRGVDPSNLQVVIIEEWRNFRGAMKWQSNSKNPTSQVIGALKFWARFVKATVVEQRSDIKETAAKWAQIKIPKGHMPDHMAAYLHGYYYLHRNGIIRPSVLGPKGKS